MTTHKTFSSQQFRTARVILLASACAIMLLEIIFSVFTITGRPFDPNDVAGSLIFLAAVCTRPKLLRLSFDIPFKRLPLADTIVICAACYILLTKGLYFGGYFAHTIYNAVRG